MFVVITKCKTSEKEWLETSDIRQTLNEAIETYDYCKRQEIELAALPTQIETIGIFEQVNLFTLQKLIGLQANNSEIQNNPKEVTPCNT